MIPEGKSRCNLRVVAMLVEERFHDGVKLPFSSSSQSGKAILKDLKDGKLRNPVRLLSPWPVAKSTVSTSSQTGQLPKADCNDCYVTPTRG